MGPCANARKGPEALIETLNNFRVCSSLLSAKNMHYFYHKEAGEKKLSFFLNLPVGKMSPRGRPVQFLHVVFK